MKIIAENAIQALTWAGEDAAREVREERKQGFKRTPAENAQLLLRKLEGFGYTVVRQNGDAQ